MSDDNKNAFTPGDMPQKEIFTKREIYQHPQPADTGKALNTDEKKDRKTSNEKEAERTAKEEGLNQVRSNGNAGAFEGFENQGSSE